MGLTCLITLLHFSTHTSQCTSIASWFVAGDALFRIRSSTSLLLFWLLWFSSCVFYICFNMLCTFCGRISILVHMYIHNLYIHIYEFIYIYEVFSSFQWVLLGITNWIWAVQLCAHSLTGGSHETGYCQWAYLLQVFIIWYTKGFFT
jgi:hypothetical protein